MGDGLLMTLRNTSVALWALVCRVPACRVVCKADCTAVHLCNNRSTILSTEARLGTVLFLKLVVLLDRRTP